jgi:subtilisin
MTDQSAPRPVAPRRERYLVAPLAGPAVELSALGTMPSAPQFADSVLAQLAADPMTNVHRVITPAEGAQVSAFGAGPGALAYPRVAVVDMEPDRAAALNGNPLVHVEPDLPLQYTAPDPGVRMSFADPGVIPPGDETSVVFTVLGSDGKAVEGAEVYLMNEAFPVRGTTGGDGTVVLTAPAGVLPVIAGVYVKPRHDYWAVWLGRPDLTIGSPNLITCPSLAETFPGFPQRQLDGWGRRALRFDGLPPTFRGHGVKIGIIDSGAAIEHPDLSGRIAGGRDIPADDDAGWKVDTVGHGTHTTGIVGGSDNGYGIVGVVPEAEIHSYKIFPGGRFSDLIEALDHCIAEGMDVVNLSLGSPQPSHLLARKIEQARRAGIACVVAAGNSGGPVCFPANLPSVLAVAAIGKVGEYPPESYHATQVYGMPTPEGYFSTTFTCFGPGIDVCAPGVAIVSSVPPTDYAAMDGTSFAAPYVTGLAALLLAHHPELRDQVTGRTAARVDRLFEIIKGSCRPLALGDPGRSGAGLPDAVAAFGLVPPVSATPPAHPGLAQLWAVMAQAGLIPVSLPTTAPAGGPGGVTVPVRGAWTGPNGPTTPPAGIWPGARPVTPPPAGWTAGGFPPGFHPAGWLAGTHSGTWPAGIHPGLFTDLLAGRPDGKPVPWPNAPGGIQPGAPGAGFPGSSEDGNATGTDQTAGTTDQAGNSAENNAPGVTLTALTADALDPLRAAMRAAGLLPHDPTETPPPST